MKKRLKRRNLLKKEIKSLLLFLIVCIIAKNKIVTILYMYVFGKVKLSLYIYFDIYQHGVN